MLYMKEQRAKVVSECTLKESAAINQILGRKVSHVKQAEPTHTSSFDHSKSEQNLRMC